MNETPVGMKCPKCAKVEFRNAGGCRQYGAGAAGLVASALLGYGLFSVMGRIGFLTALILGGVVGLVVQKVGARRRGLGGTAAVAMACGLAMGVLALGASLPQLATPAFLMPAAISAAAAAFMATR